MIFIENSKFFQIFLSFTLKHSMVLFNTFIQISLAGFPPNVIKIFQMGIFLAFLVVSRKKFFKNLTYF